MRTFATSSPTNWAPTQVRACRTFTCPRCAALSSRTNGPLARPSPGPVPAPPASTPSLTPTPRTHPHTGPRTGHWTSLTSFVGRENELSQIEADLRRGRLVTLVGHGGAGKTRLATTYAGQVEDSFSGGAWLVELARLNDPADVPSAVVGVLGLREGLLEGGDGPRDTVTRLIDVLSGTETLLVLDNCEHLIDAVARLAEELLARCPGLKVLATSREPLAIAGETLCAVDPLATPEPGAPATEVLESPSIRLFLDRTASVRPDLKLGADAMPVVAEICRRLDGLPLAIELAAARLRALPLEELAARLDQRFLLLTGGSRTVLPRHQTLRAVVDWSWELLADEERRFLTRLAVFPAVITPMRRGLGRGPVRARAGRAARAGGQVAPPYARRAGGALPDARDRAGVRS